MVSVSIIMPVYNDEEVIGQSITSVANQTLNDLELIVINDGSTDNTLDILNEFADKYDFIKVVSQENQGSGKARNYGMDIANGEYIGFLDADDYFIDDDALERLYEVAVLNNANMVTGNILHDVDNPGEFVPFKHLEYFTEDKVILPEDYGIPWSFYKSIFKTDFLLSNKIYFPDLLRGQDPVFLAEILAKVDKIYAVATNVYAYVFYDAIDRCNTYRKLYDQLLHYKIVLDYLKDPRFIKANYDFKRAFLWFVNHLNEEDSLTALKIINEIFEGNTEILHSIHYQVYSKFNNNPEIEELCEYRLKPKISVIIPVYNAEPFLEEAMQSLLNQTLSDFELICVNDGSKDNSLKILQDFAKHDSRFRIIDQVNAGCGASRNRALAEACGEYIYFFDPDDYISSDAFEKLYKNAVNNKSDLVIFKIARFKEGYDVDYSNPGFNLEKVFKNKDFNKLTFSYKDVKKYVLNASFAPWSKLYKKEFLDKYYDIRFPINLAFDDTLFHIQSMLRAKKISFIPEFFYFYRFNPNSINNTASNGNDIFQIVDIVEDFLKKNNFFNEFEEEFKFFKIKQILNYLISTGSQDYFQLAKSKFLEIHLDENNILSKTILSRYNLVLNSDSLNEYISKEHDLKIEELTIKIQTLEKRNAKLIDENKKMESELNESKRLYDSIRSSRSWKMTKRFRK